MNANNHFVCADEIQITHKKSRAESPDFFRLNYVNLYSPLPAFAA